MVTLTASTVVTGLFLLAVAGATIVGSRRAAGDAGRPASEGAGGRDAHYVPGERVVSRLRTDVTAWIAGFVVATVGVAAAAILSLGDPGTLGDALPALFVAMLVLYAVAGVYLMGRQRGHSSALAVAEGAAAFGGLLVAGVVVKLVTGV